jgi:hypothetical protein
MRLSRLSLARLRPLHIAVLTVAYWLGLAVVKLGPAILAAWQVSRLPPNHGSISAGLQNTLLSVSIAIDGVAVWAGSASLGALIAWVAGPPLLLALTSRWTREAEAGGSPPPSLPAPAPEWNAARREDSEVTRETRGRRHGAG